MRFPEGGRSPKELQDEIDGWLSGHCERVSDDKYRCRKTGADIMQTTLLVSVHLAEFGDQHAGMGKVVRMPLPYCPACEPEPADPRTCVHVKMRVLRED